MDLATEWRGRRWRRLLNLIDRLPRNSGYVEAVANDDLVAEQILDRPQPEGEKPQRRMSEYSADVEMLSVIADRLSEMINVLAAVNGAKPGPMQHAPRPVTALERVRERRRVTKHRAIVARVLPRKPTE